MKEWSGYLFIPPFIWSVTRYHSCSQYIPQINWWDAYLGRRTHIHGQLLLFPPSFIRALLSLFFLYHSYSFFLCAHIFIFIFTVHACYLYVTDTLSTPTCTEPPSVECQGLLDQYCIHVVNATVLRGLWTRRVSEPTYRNLRQTDKMGKTAAP